MIARLRELNPTAKITMLCRGYTVPVVRLCADVDDVIDIESIEDDLIGYLKRTRVDTVILAQPDRALAYAAFLARVRNRIGNARQKLYQLFYCNRRVRFSKGLSEDHEAQINFEFLRPYGETNIPPREDIPALYHLEIPDDPVCTAKLAGHAFNLILHMKSNGHGREWPIEHFVSLAHSLQDNPAIHIWLTGSAAEGAWIEEHGQAILALPNVTNICGMLSLQQLSSFIKQADGLIASGTGPLHMSAAIGQRTLGLFPPTRPMHPGRWAALGRRAINLTAEKSCEDCRRITTPTCDCMRQITPATVLQIVLSWEADQKSLSQANQS
ncbi:glycosyltransferase family 9 protein [Herbaspirillum sp. alder98]|uniref:glycosyltransferase family 9 protein n=1 Tax=Herbaspirillum sp. alder98 TaxID=2913096 RepID=UPI002A599EAF|nr:glycosyltransferase family 9 protein [Herbaspirillum sp. alder98]